MVLINGSNFIDVQWIILSYFSIVLFVIYKLNFNDLIILETEPQIILSVIILFVLVLNFLINYF